MSRCGRRLAGLLTCRNQAAPAASVLAHGVHDGPLPHLSATFVAVSGTDQLSFSFDDDDDEDKETMGKRLYFKRGHAEA